MLHRVCAVLQLRPRQVEALRGVDVVHASAGSGHTLAVSAGGALYTWGQGYNGRLGHGNQETKLQPALVEALVGLTVISAVAGSEFTICVTDKGTRPRSAPRRGRHCALRARASCPLYACAPGLDSRPRAHIVTCALLASRLVLAGAAHSWGNGDYTGTVWWGRGWEGGSPRVLLPARIKDLGEARVDLLAAGSAHTMLTTECGALYTFGSGAQGQLGHGDLQEQLLPKRVEPPGC